MRENILNNMKSNDREQMARKEDRERYVQKILRCRHEVKVGVWTSCFLTWSAAN